MSRDWISRSGPRRHRHTTLVFVLRRATLVEFVVVQVAPDCRRIGRFRVQGRRGVNRVRLRGRIGRHRLGPGTYRLVARALPGGRRVVDTRLVVVQRADGRAIQGARKADVCSSASGSGAGTGSGSGSSSSATSGPASGQPRPGTAGKPEQAAQPPRHRGVLGAKFARRAVNTVTSIPLWLYALLGLAIALLAVAALPLRATPTRGAATVLARHRGVIALAGAALLVMVTVAYALL